MRKVFKDIAIDIIKEKPKTRTGEYYRDWEYDKRITVVDINAQESVKGLIYADGKPKGHNMLTTWFWGVFEGLIADDNPGDMVNANDGTTFTIRTSGDANAAAAYMKVGSSNLSEGFLDYNLKSPIKNLNPTFTLTKTTSDARVIVTAPTDVNIQELAIIQYLIGTDGVYRDVLYSRKVISISAGKTINWSLTFGSPWTLRIAEIWYGFIRNADTSVTDTSGTAFTARTSADLNSGKAYLVYSANQTTWSPDTYVIPNANSNLSMTYWAAYNQRSFRLFGLLGSITPGTDTTVNTLGIYFPVYDTSGTTHQVCIAAIPLATPITFYANRVNLVMLRIVAA